MGVTDPLASSSASGQEDRGLTVVRRVQCIALVSEAILVTLRYAMR